MEFMEPKLKVSLMLQLLILNQQMILLKLPALMQLLLTSATASTTELLKLWTGSVENLLWTSQFQKSLETCSPTNNLESTQCTQQDTCMFLLAANQETTVMSMWLSTDVCRLLETSKLSLFSLLATRRSQRRMTLLSCSHKLPHPWWVHPITMDAGTGGDTLKHPLSTQSPQSMQQKKVTKWVKFSVIWLLSKKAN